MGKSIPTAPSPGSGGGSHTTPSTGGGGTSGSGGSGGTSGSGGSGGSSGGGGDPYLAAQRKAQRKAAQRYMQQAATLQSQADSLALALGQIDGGCDGRGLVVLVDGIGDHQLQGVEVLGLAKLAQPVALVTQFFNRGM